MDDDKQYYEGTLLYEMQQLNAHIGELKRQFLEALRPFLEPIMRVIMHWAIKLHPRWSYAG